LTDESKLLKIGKRKTGQDVIVYDELIIQKMYLQSMLGLSICRTLLRATAALVIRL